MPLYHGPLPAVDEGADSEAVAQLLNHAVSIPEDGLAEAIEEGREGGNLFTDLTPATVADDQSLRDTWAALTGDELGPGEVARVGVAGREDTTAVSWAALRKALAELRAMRATWQPEPGPWLFVRPVKLPYPTPEDYAIVTDLELEAAAIDDQDLDAEVGREPVELIERRRRFLKRCQQAGIFDQSHAEVRSSWIGAAWCCNRLSDLRAAVTRLREWGLLESDQEPLDGPVCLDYVRHELWPPGDDGLSWARSAISLLCNDPPAGDQGMIIESVGGTITTVAWRRDGDGPALVGISREERDRDGGHEAKSLKEKLELLQSEGVDADMSGRLRTVHEEVSDALPPDSGLATPRIVGHLLHQSSGPASSPISGLHLDSALRAVRKELVSSNKPLHLVPTADSPRVATWVTYHAYEQWVWKGGGCPRTAPHDARLRRGRTVWRLGSGG